MAQLSRITWPDFGPPDLPPPFTLLEAQGRLAALRHAGRHYDALVIYGDREHAANLHWITGFDPRFEEALLIVTEGSALLLAGNECLPYTRTSPLVRSGDITTGHCASFSLPSQPRGSKRIADWLADAVPAGATVGAVGWKWFGPDEVDDPATATDLPAFIIDPLRSIASRVENATALMMHPSHGLRARVDAAEIARLEFANYMAAHALRRMVHAFKPGRTDFDVVQAAGVGGLPLGCHITFATGARADQGLSGPTGQRLRAGSPIGFNICHWGANICRAGWLARSAADLPKDAQDYLAAFALPYAKAMSDWCAMMQPGTTGGAVWDMIQSALPHETFGITLNPGHLIGLDEWISSPIYQGSTEPLTSGMAMQMDVIPGHATYGSTRMEDGYVIADATLRMQLAAHFPAVLDRAGQRRSFMREVIGMDVPNCLLPLADTCGIIAPWLFAPGQVITL
ncbi:MAG: M24 family metallopeptidase [Paracoccaceae bacterium]